MRAKTAFPPLLAALLGVTGTACSNPPFAGEFQVGGQARTITDAVAFVAQDQGLDEVIVVFNDHPFDRDTMLEDGRLDRWDFVGLQQGAQLHLSVARDGGELQGFHIVSLAPEIVYEGKARAYDDLGGALTISRLTDDAIAGHFRYGEHEARFDLPLTASAAADDTGRASGAVSSVSTVSISSTSGDATGMDDDGDGRSGSPLPAGGGEPGLALQRMVAAVHAGDLDTLVANMPEADAEEVRAAIASGEAEAMLQMARAFTPSKVDIQGGQQDGDRAWLDFTGTESGAPVTGSAEMVRSEGSWRVVKINTTSRG